MKIIIDNVSSSKNAILEYYLINHKSLLYDGIIIFGISLIIRSIKEVFISIGQIYKEIGIMIFLGLKEIKKITLEMIRSLFK